MYGSATFAIVVSSACMIVASITQIVIAPRLPDGAPPGLMVSAFAPLAEHAREIVERARAAGCDFDFCAHARTQWMVGVLRVDLHAHGDALHRFHPIARGVLRRN